MCFFTNLIPTLTSGPVSVRVKLHTQRELWMLTYFFSVGNYLTGEDFLSVFYLNVSLYFGDDIMAIFMAILAKIQLVLPIIGCLVGLKDNKINLFSCNVCWVVLF